MANKVILIGRLTRDPEVRYTNTNLAVTNFTIAVDRKFKKEGERQADFFSIVAWQKTAEFIEKYFSKGRKIVVIGRLQSRTWDDSEGKKHYVTEVVAEEVDFADGKKGNSNTGDAYEPTSNSSSSSGGFYPLEEDDELPF